MMPFPLSEPVSTEQLCRAGDELVGPFEHIINFVKLPKESFPSDEQVYAVYQLLQQEADYAVTYGTKSICAVICAEHDMDSTAAQACLKSCIEGLAPRLGEHGILINGCTADEDTEEVNMINAAMYLSGKYGQIMTGQVLELH